MSQQVFQLIKGVLRLRVEVRVTNSDRTQPGTAIPMVFDAEELSSSRELVLGARHQLS